MTRRDRTTSDHSEDEELAYDDGPSELVIPIDDLCFCGRFDLTSEDMNHFVDSAGYLAGTQIVVCVETAAGCGWREFDLSDGVTLDVFEEILGWINEFDGWSFVEMQTAYRHRQALEGQQV
ncbi:MAG: hypothetical protein AAF662_03145 [Pseudomonadota bacterium]